MPSKTEVAKVKDLSPAIIDLERLIARMNEIHEAIGRRAYELFEARGREHGHDLEDWLDAERELVQFFPVVLTDSRESLIVRSEVPGFTGDEIEVGVEPDESLSVDEGRLKPPPGKAPSARSLLRFSVQ